MSFPPPPTAAQLAQRVANWHNRHPLACRIAPTQVQGVGVVALPFVGENAVGEVPADPASAAGNGLSLRQRALAKAQQPEDAATGEQGAADPRASTPGSRAVPLRCGFVEDFIAPISPAKAARLAARHGSDHDPSGGRWPRRDVQLDSNACGAGTPRWRFLMTAAIETQNRRVRVLIAADGSARIVGGRLWDLGRMMGAGVALLPLLILSIVSLWHADSHDVPAPGAVVAQQVELPAPPASVEPMVPPSPTVPAEAPLPAPAPATAPTPAPLSEPAPVAQNAESTRVDIRPRLNPELARAARAQAAALRAMRRPAMAASGDAASATASVDDKGKTFAVVARQTKSRGASELLLSVIATEAGRQGRAEVVRSADGFRASWWPFVSRQEANAARDRLAAHGLPVEVIEF